MKDNSLAEFIISGAFDKVIDATQCYRDRKTGFENLDEEQTFLPGLYVLGGTPGTGKTTFALQLLSNLAAGDSSRHMAAERAVFVAYEMSRAELTAKSIAREVRRMKFKNDSVKCLSSSQIRLGAGRFNDAAKEAQAKLADSMRNLQILEMENQPLDELLKNLKEEAEAAKTAGVALTVAIDYLQLIPVKDSKATAKERVDELVLRLKQFQRETDATLLVISSLNRAACVTGGASMFSFKESGSVEYSADVIWLLEGIEEERKLNPRTVQLKCVKNRHGYLYSVVFDFFASSDYFRGCPPRSMDSTKKSNRHC